MLSISDMIVQLENLRDSTKKLPDLVGSFEKELRIRYNYTNGYFFPILAVST